MPLCTVMRAAVEFLKNQTTTQFTTHNVHILLKMSIELTFKKEILRIVMRTAVEILKKSDRHSIYHTQYVYS